MIALAPCACPAPIMQGTSGSASAVHAPEVNRDGPLLSEQAESATHSWDPGHPCLVVAFTCFFLLASFALCLLSRLHTLALVSPTSLSLHVMAHNGAPTNGSHVPHDSALSVGSSDEAVKVRELESEVKILAEKATNACMYKR